MYDKTITVLKLKALLDHLPADYILHCNTLGNLTVLDGTATYRGYVDFFFEELHDYKEVEEL